MDRCIAGEVRFHMSPVCRSVDVVLGVWLMSGGCDGIALMSNGPVWPCGWSLRIHPAKAYVPFKAKLPGSATTETRPSRANRVS